jgi:2-dehydro-3-deoxygluconokinase
MLEKKPEPAARYDLVTFGEAMVRLSPPNFRRLEQTASFDVFIGGAEMNVAVAASRLGLKAAYVTRLPRNPLGRMVANKCREQGVDTNHFAWCDGGRVGLYFCEFGAMPRASSVMYDRKGSAISHIEPGMVPWDEIFVGTRHFHTTGITPALSPSAAAVTREALDAARKAGISTSVDLNYRAKLWSEEEARAYMTELMQFTDILITTEEDTYRVFKIRGSDYKEVAEKLTDRFGFRAVAITLRENITIWRNRWTVMAYADGKFYEDKTYELEIVDRLGGGDSFAAGFLYGYLKGDLDLAVRYGNAYAALKHSMPGDFHWGTLEEVEKLATAASGLRIER